MIPEDAHAEWFRRQLNSSAVAIWILEADGQAAGYLRVQETGKGDWLLSLALEHRFRGHGLGRKALLEIIRMFRSHLGARRLVAEVLATNTIGQRLFVAAGYSRAGQFEETGRIFTRFEYSLIR
jgi:ribosomal protein S18 acetylase RimI-like enzyme